MCELGSRRSVEKYIESGRVSVNGKIADDLSTQVDIDKDTVCLDGKKLTPEQDKYYLIMNKPPKYIVSKDEQFGRKTVFELIPDLAEKVFAVGRLDYHSEGLLILTNDGELANKLMHPTHKIPKVYKVVVADNLNSEQIDKLRKGIVLDGKKTLPAQVHYKESKPGSMRLRMVIYEGKNRQIRRMIEAVGSKVLELKRLQIGPVKLGKLPRGMWRPMTPREIGELKKRINR